MANDLLTLPERPIEEVGEPAPPKTRRRRVFQIDQEDAVEHVLRVVEHARDERIDWMSQRLQRYAKLRGWKEQAQPGEFDWSNQHVPVMLANSLRVKAGLFNAVLGIRPVMQGRPLEKKHPDAASRVDDLIDFQVFQEAEGEQRIGQFIDQFVDDGTVFAYVPWVRETRKMVESRIVPRPARPLSEALLGLLPRLFPSLTKLVLEDAAGYSWSAEIAPRNPADDPTDVEIEIYDKDDDRIEIVQTWNPTILDGPQIIVQALEDVVAPMRSENLQPITPANPFGAPWAARMMQIDLDTILRRIDDGTYEFLEKSDKEELESLAHFRVPLDPNEVTEDQIKLHKERLQGLQTTWGLTDEKQWLTLVEWYGQWDVDGDGLKEEVILWTLKEPKKLARARYLTELYPAIPPRRPLAESRYVPVPQMLYGLGLPEIMEGLHDLIHVAFNQTIDNGTITNAPFWFYRASSGVKPEIIRLWPGEGYPVDNPGQDVFFPTLPHSDQTWGMNMIALGMQFMDRLVQIGPLQLGQVPTGKASALRTVGTTMAILQQGAAMPEQILRRLFHGFKQIWEQFHLLNGRFLPRHKEYLIAGKAITDADAYGVIETPDEIGMPMQFDFQATLLNTNKGIVAQALTGILQALASPLALQLKLVDPERLYNAFKDLIQANQLDPSRYLVKPPEVPEGPRMLWEEALQMILNGEAPAVAPLEPVQEHYQKMMAFMQSDEFGLLQGQGVILFREYLRGVLAAVRQAVQAQQLAQAAQQFTQTLHQQGADGGVPSPMEAPPMQAQAPTQAELGGGAPGA